MVEIEVEAANLIRRREEVATAIAREVIDQVLPYEQMGRQLELLDSQIVTQRHRQAMMEVGYRMGQGSTGTMLTVWQQTEDMEARRVEMAIAQDRVAAELGKLNFSVDRMHVGGLDSSLKTKECLSYDGQHSKGKYP